MCVLAGVFSARGDTETEEFLVYVAFCRRTGYLFGFRYGSTCVPLASKPLGYLCWCCVHVKANALFYKDHVLKLSFTRYI